MSNGSRRTGSRKYLVVIGSLACVAAAYGVFVAVQTQPEYGGPPGGESVEHLAVTGRPLVVFGDLYLDGRSNWFSERFVTDRKALPPSLSGVTASLVPGAPATAADLCEVLFHFEPFSGGKWTETLSPQQVERRTVDENPTVECHVSFAVPGVTPEHAIRFLAFSGFIEQIGAKGEYGHDVYFDFPEDPKLPNMKTQPKLGPRQYLTHETWKGGFGASPTDVYYVNEVGSTGETDWLVYEAWTNGGGDDCVAVRVAAGQYVARTQGETTVVHFHNFYRGQGFMALMKSIVVSRTKSYYERYSKSVRKLASNWKPDPATTVWLEAQGALQP
ncbi:MAG: hypothetical protein AAF517_00930 [Planctomycetota bacterium]